MEINLGTTVVRFAKGAEEKKQVICFRIFLFFPCHFQKPLSHDCYNIVSFGKLEFALSLTLSQTTNFRLFQTETVCRQQFQIG